ncbi:MAG: DUF2927 domain-containing protein, partial [Pseudomonadota bacterium]
MRGAAAALAAALALAGCATPGWDGGVPPPGPAAEGLVPQGSTAFANADLAVLLVRLAFEREDGKRFANANRIPQPVRLVPDPRFDGGLDPFLVDFAAWMDRHAGIDLRLADEQAAGAAARAVAGRVAGGAAGEAALPPAPGQGGIIALRPVSAAWRDRAAANVQCFFLYGPPVDVERYRGEGSLVDRQEDDWTGRGIVTVYLPDDLEGDELAGCLYEEIVQALGLANDIPDLLTSIFNDDNVHLAPTALDLLMVRTLYALSHEGTEDAVRAEREARAALAELNAPGRSETARRLGLAPRAEALAYARALESARAEGGGVLDAGRAVALRGRVAGAPLALRCA